MTDNTAQTEASDNLDPGQATADLTPPPDEVHEPRIGPLARKQQKMRDRRKQAVNAPTRGWRYWLFWLLTLFGAKLVPTPSLNERLENEIERLRDNAGKFRSLVFATYNIKGSSSKTTTLLLIATAIFEKTRRWLMALDCNIQAGNLADRVGVRASETIGLREFITMMANPQVTTNDLLALMKPSDGSREEGGVGLRVVRYDDPRESTEGAKIGFQESLEAIKYLTDHCEVVPIDTANNIDLPAIHATSTAADVAVFTARAAKNERYTLIKLGTTMNTLRAQGYNDLVDHAVVEIVGAHKTNFVFKTWWNPFTWFDYHDYSIYLDELEGDGTIKSEAKHLFQGQIAHMPNDRFVNSGEPMRMAGLRKRTQLAALKLTNTTYDQALRLRTIREQQRQAPAPEVESVDDAPVVPDIIPPPAPSIDPDPAPNDHPVN